MAEPVDGLPTDSDVSSDSDVSNEIENRVEADEEPDRPRYQAPLSALDQAWYQAHDRVHAQTQLGGYDEARKFFRDRFVFLDHQKTLRPLPGEEDRIFQFNMPHSDYTHLREDFDLDALSLVRFWYDLPNAILKFRIRTSALHFRIVNFVKRGVTDLNRNLPNPREGVDFPDYYVPLEMKGDLSVAEHDFAQFGVKQRWALEIGQTKGDQHDRAKMWFQGDESMMEVVVVTYTEAPYFECPLDYDMGEDQFRQLGLSPDSLAASREFACEGPLGLVKYKGHMWAGEITSVTWEVMRRGPPDTTGTPTCYCKELWELLLPFSNPQVALSRILSSVGRRGDPRWTSFDWNGFREHLHHPIKAMAVERYQVWLTEHQRRRSMVAT